MPTPFDPYLNSLSKYHLYGQAGSNPFDRAHAAEQSGKQWQAITAGAQHDREQYKQMLRGLATMTGAPRSNQFEPAIDGVSKTIAGLAPYIMTTAPDLWDQLHGTRGSAAHLALSMQRANPRANPQDSAATAGEVWNRLHGPGGPGASGFSGKELGSLYEQMHSSGLLSHKGGIQPPTQADRLARGAVAGRAIVDTSNRVLPKIAAVLPNLLKGTLAVGLGLGAGEAIKTVLPPKRDPSIMQQLQDALPHNPFRMKLPPEQKLPQAFDTKGNFTGFKPMSEAERVRHFQSASPVAHPGYNLQPPPKPELFRRLTNPLTAAAAEASLKTAAKRWRLVETLTNR